MREHKKDIIINGRNIAINYIDPIGNSPTILWLGGYLSDMFGSKANFLRNLALDSRLGCVFFDYSYTGLSQSSKEQENLFIDQHPAACVKKSFLQACLSDWLEEALYVYKNFCRQETIIIGSSCGAWIAILLSQLLHKEAIQVKSLVLLAPAPDFTSRLLYNKLTSDQIAYLKREKYIYIKQEGSEISLPFSKKFIEDAKQHHIFDKILDISIPTYLLHGDLDNVVPLSHAMQILNCLPYSDTSFTIMPGADHSLSRPQDLAKLAQIISL